MPPSTTSVPKSDHVINTTLNLARKSIIFVGCSDARLFPIAWQDLLEALGHKSGYPELIPGGCNVLTTEYANSPTYSPEAARVFEHVYALLRASAQGLPMGTEPDILEIVWVNHTLCKRQELAGVDHGGDNAVDLRHNLKRAEEATQVVIDAFKARRVQADLHGLGYAKLSIRTATCAMRPDETDACWHISAATPIPLPPRVQGVVSPV